VTERDKTDDLLDARQFVSVVVSAVRAAALQGTFNTLRQPPGRDPDAGLLQLAQWSLAYPRLIDGWPLVSSRMRLIRHYSA
jgi:hypothetical protein